MSSDVASQILEAPLDREALMKAAFPQTRKLIADDTYKSESDENVFKRWYREIVVPAMGMATEEVKESLRYCLETRGKIELTALAAGTNFLCGFLPNYPGGLVPAVAALIVLTAYELKDNDLI